MLRNAQEDPRRDGPLVTCDRAGAVRENAHLTGAKVVDWRVRDAASTNCTAPLASPFGSQFGAVRWDSRPARG